MVLTDVKCITKHQYSSDLWPLKIKRNCIVDKSLAVCIVDKSLAVRLHVLVFVLPNDTIRIKIPPFDSALEIVITDVKCITKRQYSSGLWPLSLKAKRNCIVDKLLKIIKLIMKNAVRLILDNFGIIGFLIFGRIPVDSSHFSLHFNSILSPKSPQIFYFERFKAQFNITKYNFTCDHI